MLLFIYVLFDIHCMKSCVELDIGYGQLVVHNIADIALTNKGLTDVYDIPVKLIVLFFHKGK